MYNYAKQNLDDMIKDELRMFFENVDVDMVLLSDLGQLIKMELNDKINLTFNNKRRNITSYIRNNHNSLSKFIQNKTNHTIDIIEGNVCVLR